MSKVPYTVNVEEYVCSALEEIRKMNKTRDYSGLMAAVERIQHHANQMEGALSTYHSKAYMISKALKDEDLTDRKKVRAIEEAMDDK